MDSLWTGKCATDNAHVCVCVFTGQIVVDEPSLRVSVVPARGYHTWAGQGSVLGRCPDRQAGRQSVQWSGEHERRGRKRGFLDQVP